MLLRGGLDRGRGRECNCDILCRLCQSCVKTRIAVQRPKVGFRPARDRYGVELQVGHLCGWKPEQIMDWLFNNPNGPDDREEQENNLLSVCYEAGPWWLYPMPRPRSNNPQAPSPFIAGITSRRSVRWPTASTTLIHELVGAFERGPRQGQRARVQLRYFVPLMSELRQNANCRPAA
jgi:hypothetical protein